jgi:tetratricopeptide (TPR) repeat protein
LATYTGEAVALGAQAQQKTLEIAEEYSKLAEIIDATRRDPTASSKTEALKLEAMAAAEKKAFAQAAALWAQRQPLIEKLYGATHWAAFENAEIWADSLEDAEKIREAIVVQLSALALAQKLFSAQDPRVDKQFRNLARMYVASGDYSLAKRYALEALKIAEMNAKLQPNALGLRLVMVAQIEQLAKNFDEALAYYFRAEKVYENVHGPKSKEVIATQTTLTTLLSERVLALDAQGQAAAALETQRKALALMEKVYGADSQEFQVALSRTAIFSEALNRSGDVIALLEKVVELSTRRHGRSSNDTMIAISNLSRGFKRAGQAAAAKPLAEEALAIATKLFGTEHENTAIYLGDLALLQALLGDYFKAVSSAEQALSIHEKTQGPDHLETGIASNNPGKY